MLDSVLICHSSGRERQESFKYVLMILSSTLDWYQFFKFHQSIALHDEDTFGGANYAYVEAYIDDDYKQRTATISNLTTLPWSETFQLQKYRVEKNQHHIHLKVYDQNVGSRDEIGSAKIDLKPIKISGTFDDWIKMTKLFGLTREGLQMILTIRVHIVFISFSFKVITVLLNFRHWARNLRKN
ncbi:unnamed protein product [Rotaria magnacalcarata]|uniref:C2 domain-containing protein n=2 Tax=Rotaria magnacalcarata TaxID=392030 RepID=A0A8S2MJJ9_9BILA|nr:unnamed protein product [Rotaria magnacalcarata]